MCIKPSHYKYTEESAVKFLHDGSLPPGGSRHYLGSLARELRIEDGDMLGPHPCRGPRSTKDFILNRTSRAISASTYQRAGLNTGSLLEGTI